MIDLPKTLYVILNHNIKSITTVYYEELKYYQEQDNFKKEIEKNKEDYEKIIEEAADEIENFVQKVSTENPIQ